MKTPDHDSQAVDVLRVQSDAEAGLRLDLVGYVDFPPGHQGTVHTHPFWEVIYVGSGRGELVRDDVRQACGRDDIFLIRPEESHQMNAAAGETLEQYYFGFSFAFTPVDSLTWTAPRSLPAGPLLDLIRSELRQCCELMRGQKDKVALEVSRARLMPVVSRVVGYLVTPVRKVDSHGHAEKSCPIVVAKEFLQTHLQSQITVRELAKRFGLSPQYFGELFKRETGMTVKEFQTKVRTQKAMEMLQASDRRISDIAREVGMADLAYFSRVFKKQFKLSPRQARRDTRDTADIGLGA